MRRRPQKPRPTGASQYRINHQIRIPQIRVIGPEGDQLGIMSPDEARDIAVEAGLDLVEVAPTAKPPVCRIMDYGKFRYEQSKKVSSARSARVEIKTLRMRPKTDTHDMETITRKARSFLEKGDKVRFVMRLRGREQAHISLWITKLNAMVETLNDIATVIQTPRIEGRMITATIEPNNSSSQSSSSSSSSAPSTTTSSSSS
ncbi:MAG: translation initiation factor IF-3 [Deltaproteobacteria bacterium CG2_30_63_29]|nr:MAG: translation initiation factor IF-3 [Deltaproteobacteria bacterium CG2_30_63_29]PJB42377.1 MAG: translation initiation factor IF-3 [Deltaproteobacteria bacterium CG_4_9_14_3_um_filter_63_12]